MKRVSFIVKEWSDLDDTCLVGGSAKSPFRAIKYLSEVCARQYVIHFYGPRSADPKVVLCSAGKTKLFFKTLLQNLLATPAVYRAFSESDVIQCHHPHFGLSAALLKTLLFKHKAFIVKAHGTALPELQANAYNGARGFLLSLNARVHYWIDRLVLAKADVVVCSSKYQEHEMQRLYRVAALKLTTIYNGFDPEFFGKRPAVNNSRRSIRLGFCGRSVPKKNITYCFDLCDFAHTKQLSVELELVLGKEDIDTFTEVLQRAARSPYPVRIHHSLTESELACTLSACDAGLVPSVGYESIPSIVYEFAAVGVPVFATYKWGIPEVLKPEFALTGLVDVDLTRIRASLCNSCDSLLHPLENFSYHDLTRDYLKLYETP
jgi:glycosyltransferase involved in cell wall biosynthesis